MMKEKILNLIGLTLRAQLLISGNEQTITAIRLGEVELVIIAKDASTASSKRIMDKCNFYGVTYIQGFTSEELGRAIGKEYTMSIGIKEAGIASKILAMYNNMEVS